MGAGIEMERGRGRGREKELGLEKIRDLGLLRNRFGGALWQLEESGGRGSNLMEKWGHQEINEGMEVEEKVDLEKG